MRKGEIKTILLGLGILAFYRGLGRSSTIDYLNFDQPHYLYSSSYQKTLSADCLVKIPVQGFIYELCYIWTIARITCLSICRSITLLIVHKITVR